MEWRTHSILYSVILFLSSYNIQSQAWCNDYSQSHIYGSYNVVSMIQKVDELVTIDAKPKGIIQLFEDNTGIAHFSFVERYTSGLEGTREYENQFVLYPKAGCRALVKFEKTTSVNLLSQDWKISVVSDSKLKVEFTRISKGKATLLFEMILERVANPEELPLWCEPEFAFGEEYRITKGHQINDSEAVNINATGFIVFKSNKHLTCHYSYSLKRPDSKEDYFVNRNENSWHYRSQPGIPCLLNVRFSTPTNASGILYTEYWEVVFKDECKIELVLNFYWENNITRVVLFLER